MSNTILYNITFKKKKHSQTLSISSQIFSPHQQPVVFRPGLVNLLRANS